MYQRRPQLFLRPLPAATARGGPPHFPSQAQAEWLRHFLGCTVARAFACSLLDLRASTRCSRCHHSVERQQELPRYRACCDVISTAHHFPMQKKKTNNKKNEQNHVMHVDAISDPIPHRAWTRFGRQWAFCRHKKRPSWTCLPDELPSWNVRMAMGEVQRGRQEHKGCRLRRSSSEEQMVRTVVPILPTGAGLSSW